MRKHRRDCLDLCAEAGLTILGVDERGRHWAVLCAEGRLFRGASPSA